MRKFAYLLLVLTLVLPLALPFGAALAQESTAVLDALQAYNENLPPGFGNIQVADLSVEILENPDLVLIDVRQPDDYAEAHIEGAINIPITELTDHLDLLPNQDADIVVYCGSGHRSVLGMVSLNLLGYDNALSMLGGLKSLEEGLIPLVTEPTDVVAGETPAFDAAVFEAVDAYIESIPQGFGTISADDLNVALVENAPVMIDVRTEPEVANGMIEGAQFITLSDFLTAQAEWPQDLTAPVVVYDSDGHRSAMAMVAMQMLGYEDVKSLGGGVKGWTAKSYPLVTE